MNFLDIFNEKYVSKYASYLDDDDDDKDENKSSVKDEIKKPIKHLSRTEIMRILGLVKTALNKYPKLKKCCDFVDLFVIDDIDDDGNRSSIIKQYYGKKADRYLKLIEGDVWSGYPDFKDSGSEDYQEDSEAFIKEVNEKIKNSGIMATFCSNNASDDEAVSFGIKSKKS